MPYEIKDINKSPDMISTIPNRDINYILPNAFRLIIEDRAFRNIQFTIQEVSIPEISVEGAGFESPTRHLSVVGDKIQYELFNIKFIVDEELRNYKEIHDWILAYILEDDTPKNRKTRDMRLLVLNSHNNISREFHFVNAFPTSLSSLDFKSTASDAEYLTADVSFAYAYFKII